MIIVPLIIIAVLLAAAAWVWHRMGEPLYRPGMVRAGRSLRAPLTPPQQPDDPAIWRVEEDIDLHHFSRGAGTPVLFIHGGPGFPRREVPPGLAQLASDVEIHFYDQRGCGRSTKPFDRFLSGNFYKNMTELDQGLGMAAQIADIERIRRILGRNKIVLMGHSFGGFLATLYAAEFPEHVEALVLVAPADLIVFPAPDGGVFDLIRRRLPDGMTVEFDRFMEEYMGFSKVFAKSEEQLAALNRDFARFYMIATGTDPAAAVAKLEEAGNGGWMVSAVFFGLGKRHDYRAALRSVSAPVLILHGERDLQASSVSQRYADLLPNARLHVIEGAGHFMFDERPTEFAEAVRTFLRGLDID